jgi:hypothetical protein
MDAIVTLMYITAVPNRHSPPAILLRESFRDGDKVRTRTLANLTSWAPERIEALRRALKGEFDGLTGDLSPVCGPIFAVLFVRPCTCTLRLITTGLPGRPSQEQKGLDERARMASQRPSES